jgi:hypothetical protein
MYGPLLPGIARFVWDSCWSAVPLGLLAASLACFGYITIFIWLVGSARPLASIIPSANGTSLFRCGRSVVFVPSYFASSSLCFTSLSIYPINRRVAQIPGDYTRAPCDHLHKVTVRSCVYVCFMHVPDARARLFVQRSCVYQAVCVVFFAYHNRWLLTRVPFLRMFDPSCWR